MIEIMLIIIRRITNWIVLAKNIGESIHSATMFQYRLQRDQ